MLAEHKGGALQPNTLHTLTAARALGGPVTVLVAGHGIGPVAEVAAKAEGVSSVLAADDPCLERGLAEPTAGLVAAVEQRCANGRVWLCQGGSMHEAKLALCCRAIDQSRAQVCRDTRQLAGAPSHTLATGAAFRTCWRHPAPLAATCCPGPQHCWMCR